MDLSHLVPTFADRLPVSKGSHQTILSYQNFAKFVTCYQRFSFASDNYLLYLSSLMKLEINARFVCLEET